MQRRWVYVGLVVVAIAISYFDRQALPVAIEAIERSISISNAQYAYLQTTFLLAYAVLYALSGRMLDRMGTRRGFALIMLWWSFACAMHGLVRSFGMLMLARLLLGAGEGGAFPAASRVVAEWVPAVERSTAMGIINAGTAAGAVLAPPVIWLVVLHTGWRAVFLAAGAAGLAWVLCWWLSYRAPAGPLSQGTLDARLAGRSTGWGEVLRMRNVQVFVFAKFMSDAAWYFLLFWLPKYLFDVRGFNMKHVGMYAWIPYAASGFGSFLGGWFSSCVLERTGSLDLARKLALGICACGMPVVMLVAFSPIRFALGFFSIAFACQQAWAGLIMTLPTDIFPLTLVGTVAGLIGCGGALGGAVFSLFVGRLLSLGFSYEKLFVLAGSFHLIGFITILLFAGKIQPMRAAGLQEPSRYA